MLSLVSVLACLTTAVVDAASRSPFAVFAVLAGDGVFPFPRVTPVARSMVERFTTTPWGSLLRPPTKPAVKENWGGLPYGIEIEYSHRPLRDVWDDLGPLRPFPADPFAVRTVNGFTTYVGWIGGQ